LGQQDGHLCASSSRQGAQLIVVSETFFDVLSERENV